MHLDDQTALQTFLKRRLEIVKPSQLIMLVIMLFEIYLNIMGSKFLRVKFNDNKLVQDTLASQMSQEICSMFPH